MATLSDVTARLRRIAALLALPDDGQPRLDLWSVLAKDRVLAGVVLVLSLFALAPLTVTTFLPLADMGSHIASASLMRHTFTEGSVTAYHYQMNWTPVPYWTLYAILGLGSWAFGPFVAAKISVALVVVGLPLAAMRVVIALRRDPRIALFAFALSWEHNLYAGWVAFLMGMSLALVGVAWLLETRTLKDALRVTALSVLIALTHAQAVMYFGLAALFVMRPPLFKRLALHTVAVSGLGVVIIPWILARTAGTQSVAEAFSFELHSPSEKLRDLFRFTLENVVRPLDQFGAALAFGTLLLGPLLVSLLPQNEERRCRWAPAGLVLVPLLLYASLPMTIRGPIYHWYTYPRYASFILLSLLFVPRPNLSGKWIWALAPGLLSITFFHTRVASQFRDFDTRASEFLKIIDAVEPDSAYLALMLQDDDPVTKLAPFNQIHCYIAAAKGGYDASLFDNRSLPIWYRRDRKRPFPMWWDSKKFNMQKHGQYYDYIVVQGKKLDPVPRSAPFPPFRPRLVVESGRFRLYKVEKDAPAPK